MRTAIPQPRRFGPPSKFSTRTRAARFRRRRCSPFSLGPKPVEHALARGRDENRVAFRRATRTVLELAQSEYINNVKLPPLNGIKIQVSGRLNGAEIARSEWVREGRVPLQTLRADIDYATAEANTIYGVLGIKIWLFKSEILSK